MKHLAVSWMRRPVAWAFALALAVLAVGVTRNIRVAGGADAYGYVSQADNWLAGRLIIPQDFAADAPWGNARYAFAPLGYRPVVDGFAIVPTYSVGLPLIMAGAKWLFGSCAVYRVSPVSGFVLILATYAIGARLRRPRLGLAAAWIVATSAAMLYMLVQPMSDVPCAALWAAVLALALAETWPAAIGAGVLAGLAILVRPNLAPAAGVVALWLLWSDVTGRKSRAPITAALFLPSVAAAAIAVALINTKLYGAATMSGYGPPDYLYAAARIMPNLRHYVWWVIWTQTPLALAGLLCLAVPHRALWPTTRERRALWLLGGSTLVVWASYLPYFEFGDWWYLRFLLPAWPAMAIGTCALAAVAWRRGRAWTRALVAAVLVGVGAYGVWFATTRFAFDLALGEMKYVEVARVVRTLTPPDAVILSMQHSGSLRYYADRLTVRWDWISPDELDGAIDWLASRGHHPYFVVEPFEVEQLRTRLKGSRAARLDWAPTMSFRDGAVLLYDALSRSPEGPTAPQAATTRLPHCVEPVPPRPYALK